MALIVPLREVVGGVEAGGGVAVDGADGELPPHPTANSRTTRSDESRYFMRRRMLPLPHSQIVCSTSLPDPQSALTTPLETAYRKADESIQHVIDLLAA